MPRDTYTVYVLEQIIPAPPGWQAAFWDATTQTHVFDAVSLFALVTPRRYLAGTTCAAPSHASPPADELREVVGLPYYPDEGFAIPNECDNYCGLVAPGYAPTCEHSLQPTAPPEIPAGDPKNAGRDEGGSRSGK